MRSVEAINITERDFQQQVIDLAKICGWEHYHTWNSYRSDKGFPDLILVRSPRIVIAELKSEKREATPDQLKWLDMLKECPGVETYLWRPSDIERVAEILRRMVGDNG